MEENLGTVDVELTVGELRELNDALTKIEILGDRYPAEYAKRVGKSDGWQSLHPPKPKWTSRR